MHDFSEVRCSAFPMSGSRSILSIVSFQTLSKLLTPKVEAFLLPSPSTDRPNDSRESLHHDDQRHLQTPDLSSSRKLSSKPSTKLDQLNDTSAIGSDPTRRTAPVAVLPNVSY